MSDCLRSAFQVGRRAATSDSRSGFRRPQGANGAKASGRLAADGIRQAQAERE